ncbi:MAG TPA: lipoyl(octanoyl) transferase LipB [Thermoanaerobaculia bacterium]|nr:lipoyl(octanoyl) transferase LipB [Thermoanaerobaculia bacterium]
MTPPRRRVRHGFLGRVPYAAATALQARLRDAVKAGTAEEHLLHLEHPHVYTLGRNAVAADVLAPADLLAARGVEVHETDRGGQVTYHGPGQLVGYPIVDLSPDRRDVRRYMRDLQETLRRTLADYGVAAEARGGDELGMWVGGAKIASLGVHLKRWVTTHGFALNVTTDLDLFGGIVACGLAGVTMTSIERLTGAAPPLAEVAARHARHFGEVFEREMVAWDEPPAAGEGGTGEAAAAAAPAREPHALRS